MMNMCPIMRIIFHPKIITYFLISPNRFTTGTSVGPSKGLNASLQKRGKDQFDNAVMAVTAALEKPLTALEKPLYPMCYKSVA